MESFILSVAANTKTFEQDIISGARRAEKALTIRPRIDTSGFERFSGPLGRINSQATEFNKSLEASNARVIAFGASAGAIFAVQKALQGVIRDAIDVEKVFADINSVLGQSEAGLKRFKDQVFDTARATGSSFKIASEAALELSRQGLTAEASAKRLSAALILARLGGLDAKDAVEGLTAAINSFTKEALDDVDVVNKLANVSAKFAVSEKDLTEAIKRSASAASDAGINFSELTALVTAAQQTTARGGAVIGNSLKTIFTRLQRSDTLDQLEELGVATKDVGGKLLGAQQILLNLAGVYKDLSQEQQAFISELTGGVFQINQLKAQLSDLGKSYGFYQRALIEVNKTTDEAIKRNEDLNKTTSATLNALSVSITEMGAKMGSDMFGPLIKQVSGSADEIFEILNKKGEEGGKTLGETLGKAVGGILSGPGFILAGTIIATLFAKLAKFGVDAGRSVIDILSGVERQRKVQGEIQMILEQSGKSYAEIVSGARNLEEVERRILAIVREQLATKESFNSLTSNLSPGLFRGGGISGKQGKLKNAGLMYSEGKIGLGVKRFGDPIREAIERERKGGVPASSIYVDTDPRLKSSSNPMGILVANKKDEPLGGFQGVNRAISMGIDPKKHGGGFVPNFARLGTLSSQMEGGDPNYERLAPISTQQAAGLRTLFNQLETKGMENLKAFAYFTEALNTYVSRLNLSSNSMATVQKAIGKVADVMVARIANQNTGVLAEQATIPLSPMQERINNSLPKEILARQIQDKNDALRGTLANAGMSGEYGNLFSKTEPRRTSHLTSRLTGLPLNTPYNRLQTQAELGTRRNLFDLSYSSLGEVGGRHTYRKNRPENITGIRDKLNSYQTSSKFIRYGNVDPSFVDTVGKLAKQDTIQETFKKNVKEAIKNGATFNNAVQSASRDFISSGGSAKKLRDVVIGSARTFTDLEKNLQSEKVARRTSLAEMVKGIDAERELTKAKGDYSKLTAGNKEVIKKNFREEAKQSLGFGSMTDEDIKNNPQASRAINRQAGQRIAALKKEGAATRVEIARIAERNKAEEELTRVNGNYSKLSAQNQVIIKERFRNEAKQALGFGNTTDEDLANNPMASKAINREAGRRRAATRIAGTSNSVEGRIKADRAAHYNANVSERIERYIGSGRELSPKLRKALESQVEQQILQSAEFQGLSKAQVMASPEGKRLFDRRKGGALRGVSERTKSAQFDNILSETFEKRSGGLSGTFGRKSSDLKSLMDRLPAGTKLSNEQLIAFQSRQQSLQQRRIGRTTNIGIAGSFLTSALAGSGAFGNGVGGGVAQGAATGASVGSFFGLPGIAIGAVGGGAIGGAKAKLDEPQKNFEKATKAFQDLSAELNNNVQSVQGYIVAQEHLNDLIKSGTAKESDLSNVNKQMTDLFKSITDPKARSDILNAAGNIDKINEALDKLADKNAKKIAREGVNVVIGATNSETVGGFMGVGKNAKVDNLKKVGLAIANASDITAENLNKLKNSFDKLQSGADINEVGAALAKFGIDTSGLKTDVSGLLVVLRNAIDNKQFENSLNERSKIDQGYLLQLQKYNKDYEKIVSDVDNLRSLRIEQEFSNKRVILAGRGENEKLITGTSMSLFDRSANLSKDALELQKQKEFSDLNAAGKGKLNSFIIDNLKPGADKKGFLDALNDPSANISVIDQLKKLQNLDEKSFENSGKANDELSSLLSSILQSTNELAQKQNEQTAILKNKQEIEKDMLKRRDLLSAFGGSGSLGQGINTDAIRRGFSAGGAVGISDRELSNRRYLYRSDEQAANYAGRGDRISEAQGLIQLGSLLPEAVDAFRTPENTAKIEKANEDDVLNKNNQVFLSSIQGFFEGEFKKGGAFGSGGEYSGGGKLQRDLMEALGGTDGGRDFSKLSKIVEQSQLGVRSPDAYRRLKGIVGTAGQVAGRAEEIASLRTADQFKTPAMREQEALTTSMNIADNTKATVTAIKNLQEILAERQAVLDIGKRVQDFETEKRGLEAKKEIAVKTADNFKGKIYIPTTQAGSADSLMTSNGDEDVLTQRSRDALNRVTNGGFQKIEKQKGGVPVSIFDSLNEIQKGGSIEEIVKRIGKKENSGELAKIIGLKSGEDTSAALGRFVTEFAPDRSKDVLAQFEAAAGSYNSSISEAGKKVKAMTELYNEAEISLKEFVERAKGTTQVTGSNPAQSNDRIFNLDAKESVSGQILRSGQKAAFEARSSTATASYAQSAKDFGKSVKEGLDEDGALAIAGVFSKAFKDAIIGSQPDVKAKVEQDIKTQFDIVLKDGRIDPEEIKQLQAAIKKVTEEVLVLKNGGKASNGGNTAPAPALPPGSGASR